jgi:hypothetical protein
MCFEDLQLCSPKNYETTVPKNSRCLKVVIGRRNKNLAQFKLVVHEIEIEGINILEMAFLCH